MYNAVRLDKSHWRYQLSLLDDGLLEDHSPQWKVIKTLIYGVRSCGNLAECGLRRTAEKAEMNIGKLMTSLCTICMLTIVCQVVHLGMKH